MLLVERDLGAASSRLYEEISVLVERAANAGVSAQETRLALSRIGLDVLCGAYHDYRSQGPNPKGDLIEALRAVPRHQSVDSAIGSMIVGILGGAFTDGEVEARKYVARMAPQPRLTVKPAEADPEPIELASKEWRVFAWLHRYVEVYGRSPLLRELAAGLEMTTIAVVEVLRRIEKKRAVVNVGGKRAWIPVRSP